MLAKFRAKFTSDEIVEGILDLDEVTAVSIDAVGDAWFATTRPQDLPTKGLDILQYLSADDFLHILPDPSTDYEEVYLRKTAIFGCLPASDTLSILCERGLYAAPPSYKEQILAILSENVGEPVVI